MELVKNEEAAAPATVPRPKIRTITVDTFTGFQKNEVFDKWEDGKIKIDEWKDYGVPMVQFCRGLVDRGFTLVGIVGGIGSGKTFGMKTLPTKTNIWFNSDYKDSTYKGGEKEYGTKEKPNPYQVQAKSYQAVLDTVDRIIAKGNLDERPIAFLIGHTEEYKAGDLVKQRLKTIGKISKQEVEDMFTMCYYTDVIPNAVGATYRFRTQNNGLNNCRTKESQHETLFIPNDFAAIIKSYDEY